MLEIASHKQSGESNTWLNDSLIVVLYLESLLLLKIKPQNILHGSSVRNSMKLKIFTINMFYKHTCVRAVCMCVSVFIHLSMYVEEVLRHFDL